jgi:hypothetical protein
MITSCNEHNFVRSTHCLDKRRSGRVCTVRYNVCSNSPFSKCIPSLIRFWFYIRVHEVKLDRTEQNKRYLIGQPMIIFNE